MATSNIMAVRLLDTVSTVGAGNFVGVQTFRFFVFTCIATSVTSGGTMRVEAQDFEGNIVTVATFNVTATGNQMAAITGPFQTVRGNLISRTDGTYICRMDAALPKAT